MNISNSFSEYTQEELQKLSAYVHTMQEYAEKIKAIYSRELKNPTLSQNNIAYILPHIKAEYKRLESERFPIHEIIAIYLEWHEEFLLLMGKNIGNYTNLKVLMHIDEIISICNTFSSLFKSIKS